MRRLTGSQIRRTWIEFFESKGHKWLPGVNLIPQGDKSLLWVNAGVTGLKKYFDGSEVPPCRRIVNVQKSIRTNDIENVGHTARHHTFFEMLGNFSIGDYFRQEVIPWAFEILTSEQVGFGIPVKKLYFTYSPLDKETRDLWIKCGVPADHLIALESNFWEIGKGPGGPDTEMFFDRGEEFDPEHLGVRLLQEDIDNDRYIEIWNIVFSQYNCDPSLPREQYQELPSKNIDTGAGLERIACILQGTQTNFETDLFAPIIAKTKQICGDKPYEGEYLMPYRVIADHARCLCFALSDGAYFSNEGRGYVLRRIIRRAMRFGQKLGINEPFMHKLIAVVADYYEDFYPNLAEKKDFVAKMVRSEEEKFLRTLSAGQSLLFSMIEGKKTLAGEAVFKLYDTYGFPPDMTREICQENGVEADMAGFEKAMEEQKERARNARGQIDSFHKQSPDLLAFKTPSEFIYGKTELESEVIGLFRDGQKVDVIDEEGDIAFALTPFYAEMGGQVSDTGRLQGKDFSASVSGVSKAPSGQHLLHVNVDFGAVKVGDLIKQIVDARRRSLIARNHSATHLMHAALGNVLQGKVEQKGSYVDENYLRFDFSSAKKLSDEQLAAIEREVNEKIAEGIEEVTEILPIEEAKRRGAEMEFAEKYGDIVRVVEFGEYSREFCGGTHVKNTSDIGVFVLESESAVSSGVRRIQARTSLGAYGYLSGKRSVLSRLEENLGGAGDSAVEKNLKGLKEENATLKKRLEAAQEKLASASASSLDSEFELVNGVHFLCKDIEGGRQEIMKLGDSLKVKYPDYLLLLGGKSEQGCILVSFAGGAGAKRLGAGGAMKIATRLLGGNGGGKDTMASGSAKDLSCLPEVGLVIKTKL